MKLEVVKRTAMPINMRMLCLLAVPTKVDVMSAQTPKPHSR
jgi:hypothetical protein